MPFLHQKGILFSQIAPKIAFFFGADSIVKYFLHISITPYQPTDKNYAVQHIKQVY